jgi:hypothetical protein
MTPVPLFTSIIRLAKSRHTRRAITEATRYARSPQGRARIDQVRRQLAERRSGRQR